MLELRKLKKALTGKKYIQGAFQRVVGWCETIRPIVSNTFRELRTEHFSRLRREAHVITLRHNDVPDEAVVRKNAVNRGGTTIISSSVMFVTEDFFYACLRRIMIGTVCNMEGEE